jgi:hypothetical protein
MKKFGLIVIAILAFAMLAFAQNGETVLTGVYAAVKALCKSLMDLLPIVAMLMIVIAGVIYAAGQMMGAETRARANVWATAALVGAIIAILIVVIAPPVLNIMYSGSTTIDKNICG